jgi:hypothetical protein
MKKTSTSFWKNAKKFRLRVQARSAAEEKPYTERHPQVRRKDVRSADEIETDKIERGSQCSEGFGREKSRTGKIDMALLVGFADPDEIENEERICGHTRPTKRDDDVVDGEIDAILEGGSVEEHDFRNKIKLHDPKRPSHRLKLRVHPECESDEVYLLNATPKGFDLIRWETKRMGTKTACGCYPVFVKREELLVAGYRLTKPRKSKQRAVA